jgi:hypothetical protein
MASRKLKSHDPPADIDLRDLAVAGPRLHRSARDFFGASASRCLREARRRGPIALKLEFERNVRTLSVRTHRMTAPLLATFNDLQDATEHGAYGLALATAAIELGATIANRSYKGQGFDFHLNPPGHADTVDPDDIFAGTWGLEATGVLEGDRATIDARLTQKRLQVADASETRRVLIAVVEFSEPRTVLDLQ